MVGGSEKKKRKLVVEEEKWRMLEEGSGRREGRKKREVVVEEVERKRKRVVYEVERKREGEEEVVTLQYHKFVDSPVVLYHRRMDGRQYLSVHQYFQYFQACFEHSFVAAFEDESSSYSGLIVDVIGF